MKSKTLDFRRLMEAVWWLFKQNWIVFAAAIAGVITTRLSQLVLKHMAGYAELGAYAAAWQIVLIANLFLDQVMRIGKPATARNTKPGIVHSIKIRFLAKYALVMLAVTIPFCLPMIFFPSAIFGLFFKPEFFPAVKIMPIFGVYLLLYSLGMVASQYVISARMEKGYLFSVSAGAIVSVFACQFFIPVYGIAGAAWALLLSHGSAIVLISAQTVKNLRARGNTNKGNKSEGYLDINSD